MRVFTNFAGAPGAIAFGEMPDSEIRETLTILTGGGITAVTRHGSRTLASTVSGPFDGKQVQTIKRFQCVVGGRERQEFDL